MLRPRQPDRTDRAGCRDQAGPAGSTERSNQAKPRWTRPYHVTSMLGMLNMPNMLNILDMLGGFYYNYIVIVLSIVIEVSSNLYS